jgi:hypothetical protein
MRPNMFKDGTQILSSKVAWVAGPKAFTPCNGA